ncbi:MAG TPA: hypothetical protein PKA33_17805 [Amaricoccus sp.]|uniref:hypothetical protein n=1 Tax=Amaricoccus sp. TaxID=1872485 RepID=UPI002C07F852|nr:hypothetical protein [Amaricoccus sp.]HMQ92848.1 hypothetical protein [Amaricoccus sp.]HMR37048.1 hypothetical protein [Paracoccus sp. (in: a-proteobacteria)]HMR54168.1 hypothetical protein [Amaricoccus sp.]HMU01203.1 hypothetical protein [Amaricoccus sp.]
MAADIVGWAITGRLDLVSAIRTVSANGQDVSGIVTLPPEDLLPMFRRDGSGPRSAAVRRVRPPGSETWLRITDPANGIEIEAADVLITTADLERFEDDHSLAKRTAPGGSASRYDWDGFYTALIRRIHNDGLPDTQRELVVEMQGWFERRSKDGDAPDESTIRRKISALWNELRA